ncbi:MAG: PAS domain S-box protein [Candidatus Electrothrix sp. AR4]|nr:PAS domain S-box protein [Candidatus Electrothrix sp. AR4]
MKIQNKASAVMMVFGASLLVLLSLSYEMLSRRKVIERELINLRNISDELAQHIDSHLKEKAAIALTLSTSPLLRDTLLKSNAAFAGLQELERREEINSLDRRWQQTTDVSDPFIRAHMSNPLAEYLEKQQVLLPGMYGEIFLTNAYGVMLAATSKLTTLAHAHKYWWKACFHDGQGRVFFDDRGFDASVQGYVLGVVVPIKEGNDVIGILKCNINILGPLTDVVQGFSRRNPGRIKIVRTGGLIVYEEGAIPLSTKLAEDVGTALRSHKNGFSILTPKKDKYFTASSPVPTTMGSDTIGFGGSKASLDHIKGNKGESWHVLLSLSEEKALVVAHETRWIILFGGVVFTLLTAFVALVLGKLLAKPIINLAVTAQSIGDGHLEARTDVVSTDEVGSLANSLNTMAENLMHITVSRDKLTQEIEHRKEVERKLNQFKLTLDQTLDCVFMFTPDTLEFFYVNQGAVNQVGFSREEFFKMTPLDIKPEFNEEIFRETVAPLLDGRKKFLLLQTVHQHKNGNHIPVEIHLQFVRQPTEKKGRFLAIVRDITERKNARQRLQKVLDTVDAMIYVADMETCEILLINKYVKDNFGDITGKKCWESVQSDQEGPCPFCEYYNLRANDQLLSGAHVWQVHNIRNGEWYECHDESIQWVDGRTARIQVATNISERKNVEQEREKLIKELRSALSEIQVLRGILPICSFCKNIRNDDGYYEQIEGYIHKHSGVDFSHTVCPTCMKEHYPEEYKSMY